MARICVLEPDGTLLESEREGEAAVWAARRDIWATTPEVTPATQPLLRHYFRQRRTHFGGQRPTWEQVHGIVLGPGGSALGTDGFPYAVYQYAPLTQSCLIAQAVLYGPLGAEV
eukprot:4599927-Lingulodinium_polyedra.AAC.1